MRIKIAISLVLFLSACSLLPQDTTEAVHEEEVEEVSQESESDKLARLQAEYEANEALRKTELKEFYVPLPTIETVFEEKETTVKALYVTYNIAGLGFKVEDVDLYADYITKTRNNQSFDSNLLESVNRLEEILGMVKATEINALVIDVKDDRGMVGYPSNIELVQNLGANKDTPWDDPEILMEYLKSLDVYTIARVVAFKDPHFASLNADHAIQLTAGGVYKDKSGFAWVNPFDPYVWNYQIAVAQEAALKGFDEIQFDYVRFPDNAKYYNEITTFPGRNGLAKDEAIQAFLKKAKADLEPYHVKLSADVFGVIGHSWEDEPEDIGQTWIKIASEIDVMSPMVYPSHYGSGFYGYDVPDAHPYEVVKKALQESIEKNASVENAASIRPWLQGFTASWVKGYITYDEKAVQDQIRAAYDLGIEEYIIWMSSNKYQAQAYFTENFPIKALESGYDRMDRSAEDALKRYLDAQKALRLSHLYLLTPIAQRSVNYDEFAMHYKANNLSLKSYEILSIAEAEGIYSANVSVKYTSDLGIAEGEYQYQVALENEVFKITVPQLNFVKDE